MLSFFTDPFIQMALLASLVSSIASGTIGAFVVVKRIVFIAGSIAHAILAGMSFGLYLERVYGFTFLGPLEGALLAAIASALLLGWIHLNYRQREDSLISCIWSTGMALGVLFLSLTPGNSGEVMNYLFGNILWITGKDILLLALLDGAILLTLIFNYRKVLALCFDEEQALLQGVKVQKLYLILLCFTAITTVLLMQIIGTILVIALLAIPATVSSLLTRKLSTMMIGGALASLFFCSGGLFVSYSLDIPPGATIALFAAICYVAVLLWKKRTKSKRKLDRLSS